MNRPPERDAVRRPASAARHAPRPANRAPARTELAERLAEGCEELKLNLGFDERERLLSYLDLLQRWNRVYNLTAIRDPANMLVQHLLDSLAVLRPLDEAAQRVVASRAGSGPCLLDVGSGAGLPGLALALAWPALEADLVEPVGKKAAFLRQSVAELGLAQRVRVHEGRIQEARLPRAPDLAICRAFASLNEFATLIEPLLTPETVVFAMKGQRQEIEAEATALAPGWRLVDIAALVVPGLGAARHLVELAQPTRMGR
jgi:16S rRNA (guanine527-N7)-methyltransferase